MDSGQLSAVSDQLSYLLKLKSTCVARVKIAAWRYQYSPP
jgi:hypothetical protein